MWVGAATRLLRDHARDDGTLTPEHRSLLVSPPAWMRQHLREVGAAGGFATGIPTPALARLYGEVAEFRSRHGSPEIDDGSPERGLRSLLGARPDDPLGHRPWDVLAHRAATLHDARSVARARAR
ncbi:MAG: hypothetical protein ACRD0M_00690 [Acidimicrobiales bacterium]